MPRERPERVAARLARCPISRPGCTKPDRAFVYGDFRVEEVH